MENPENKIYKLDDVNINFSETRTFSKNDIEELIKTPKLKYFDRDEFAVDIQRIEKFYFDRGYFDATVDTLTVKDSAEHSIKITFSINEGNPYRIEKIVYEGLDSVDEQTKLKLLNHDEKRVTVSDIFNRDNLSKELERITGILTNNGYAFAVYNPPEVTKVKSFDNTSAKIEFSECTDCHTVKFIYSKPGGRHCGRSYL